MSISERVISLFFLPVFVVDAMYKIAKLTAKAARMANKAASVGTPSSQYPPCPEAAIARSAKKVRGGHHNEHTHNEHRQFLP